MSVPATNALPPAPRRTSTRTEESRSTSSQTSLKRSYMFHVIALRAAGRLNVRVTMGPSRSIRPSSALLSLVLTGPPLGKGDGMVTSGTEAMPAADPCALEGIRVIDMTQVMAGPFCCMLLGDMGADVIKVEPPGGEASRHTAFDLAPGVSGPFLAVNRNKRGIVLDLKRSEGAAVLRRLAASADVLVENYRPGVAGRLGIDYP